MRKQPRGIEDCLNDIVLCFDKYSGYASDLLEELLDSNNDPDVVGKCYVFVGKVFSDYIVNFTKVYENNDTLNGIDVTDVLHDLYEDMFFISQYLLGNTYCE